MKIQEILTMLFEIEIVAHVAHLQTTSYAKHMALDQLYNDIVEHRDTLAEAWQGEYGIVSGYGDLSFKEGTDIVKYLGECCKSLDTFKKEVDESYIQQILDNVSELLYKVKYKLVNLK